MKPHKKKEEEEGFRFTRPLSSEYFLIHISWGVEFV